MALRSSAGALVAGLCLLAAALALLTARLISPPARSVDLGAPGDAYLAASFFGPERAGAASFRWSGPNSALVLPEHAADGLILRMRLHGTTGRQRLSLAAAGEDGGAALPASEGWRIYSLLAAAPEAPHTLQLQVYPALPRLADPRELGVAVDWVSMHPLPRGVGALPEALGAAALMAWGLALLGAALLAARPAPITPGAAWGAVGAVGAAAAALVAWAWADLYGLRWLLPLAPGPLAAASAALAGVWLLGRVPRGGPASHAAGWRALLGPALALGLAHAALWAPLPAAWRGAAALVILWAPGWLAVRLLLGHERDPAMGLALRVCGALALQVVILMAAAALPGGVTGWALIALCDLTSGALAALIARSGARPLALRPRAARRAAPWALVILVAAALRLPALGGAELHDDEASVLLAAAELAQGRSEVLLTQLKGPAQILLPAGPLALTGQLGELIARAPFAVAGLTTVLAGMALARRLAGAGAAMVAGAILALDGLLIGFSRIVQYQSLVLAMGAAACWCCWRFAQGAPGPGRYLAAAALFTAVALLGHYDAIYVLPALLWLAVAGARRRGWGPGRAARALAAPALLAAGLLASFYVPFVLHPHFARTISHLSERTGQQGAGWQIYNNLGATYDLMTVYNTPAQVWAGAALVAALLAARLWRAAGRRRAAALAALAVLGLTAASAGPWLWGEGPPALALAALAIGGAALAPAARPGLRAALIWFGGAWLSMVFLIAEPRTHIYVAVLPAALLAAAGAAPLVRAGVARPLRGALGAAALAAILWAGLHQQVVFVRQSPEYQRTYPAARLAPLPGGRDALPLDAAARFGFPGRDGWKAIGELYQAGELAGAAASNQSSEVLAWYLRGQRRCDAEPALYLIALAAPNPSIPQGYYRAATVQVDGRDSIGVYQRTPPDGPPRVVPLERHAGPFDERPVVMPPASGACGQGGGP